MVKIPRTDRSDKVARYLFANRRCCGFYRYTRERKRERDRRDGETEETERDTVGQSRENGL